jgi:CheY-like chemotaxis protein
METVLVVDNDADVLDAVAEVLLQEGFTVRRARGGAAALDVLEREGTPGAVLLDVRMDPIDGTSVSGWMRSHPAFRSVPIIFMTGDRRFRPGEGAQVLEKPFDLADLLGALRQVLGTS